MQQIKTLISWRLNSSHQVWRNSCFLISIGMHWKYSWTIYIVFSLNINQSFKWENVEKLRNELLHYPLTNYPILCNFPIENTFSLFILSAGLCNFTKCIIRNNPFIHLTNSFISPYQIILILCNMNECWGWHDERTDCI